MATRRHKVEKKKMAAKVKILTKDWTALAKSNKDLIELLLHRFTTTPPEARVLARLLDGLEAQTSALKAGHNGIGMLCTAIIQRETAKAK